MLHSELLNAIDDANGIVQDIWLRIMEVVGDKDPSITGSWCYGGRHYITDTARSRLRLLISFMQGKDIGAQMLLALPPHIEDEHPADIRCGRCKGPFHPATGHAFSATIVACGPCYGRFAAWQLKNKYGWQPLTPAQLKRLNSKKNKAAKKAARAQKAIEKQAAKEAADHEAIYGAPRIAQAGSSLE